MPLVLVEAAQALRLLAEPIPAGDSIKAQIGRAARRAGLTYNRAFDLWYRRARLIRAEELEAIRQARRSREMTNAPSTTDAARRELRELRERIERLERLLDQGGPNGSGAVAPAPREAARGTQRGTRAQDSAVAR